MPSFYSILAFAVAAATLPQQARASECVGTPGGGAARLAVEATGLRNAAGEVAFTIYADDKGRFLAKGGKLVRARVPASAPRACFWLKPARYAIAQYHDENGDHKFNRSLIAPKEGFGFSNDAPTAIGLPAFETARMTLPAGGTTVRMAMRYRR